LQLDASTIATCIGPSLLRNVGVEDVGQRMTYLDKERDYFENLLRYLPKEEDSKFDGFQYSDEMNSILKDPQLEFLMENKGTQDEDGIYLTFILLLFFFISNFI
jgi:hypothetical protein